MQFLPLLKSTAIACLLAGSLAAAVPRDQSGSLYLTAGLGIGYNIGVQYAPYDGAQDLNLGAMMGLELRLNERHLISIEGFGFPNLTAIMPRDLSVVCGKGSLTYAYEIFKFIYVGPHGFVSGGANEYTPNKVINGVYYGTIQDEYLLYGAGITVILEPYRLVHVKAYLSHGFTDENKRTNTVDGVQVGTAQSLKTGKVSQTSIGFSVQIGLLGK